MRKIFAVILVVAIAMPFVITSCKKGEEDPFLTIKSRTGRLSATWTVTEMSMTSTTVWGSNPSTTRLSTQTLNGTNMIDVTTTTQSGVSTTTDDTVTFKLEITFDKAGTWEQTEEQSDAGSGWSWNDKTVTKGIWYWAGKNKENETKNKEIVVMETTEVVNTSSNTYGGVTTTTTDTDRYTGTESDVMNMKIKKLSSKDLIVEGEGSYDDVDVDNPYTRNTTLSATFTAE